MFATLFVKWTLHFFVTQSQPVCRLSADGDFKIDDVLVPPATTGYLCASPMLTHLATGGVDLVCRWHSRPGLVTIGISPSLPAHAFQLA